MAITRINNPPFIQRQDDRGWEKIDTGKRSWGLFKGYSRDSIEARDLGLRTIHGATVALQSIPAHYGTRIVGSVQNRGSKANQIYMHIASGATAFGTFAYFFVDAWGY